MDLLDEFMRFWNGVASGISQFLSVQRLPGLHIFSEGSTVCCHLSEFYSASIDEAKRILISL